MTHKVPQQKTNFSECCGPETFDVTTQTCCANIDGYKISPLVEGRTECCGLEPINTDNEKCCESKITFNIGHGSCCASNAYNPLKSSCCDLDYSFNISLTVPEIEGLQDCCSGQSFLKTDQMCCSETLYDRQPGHECCGSELYDTARQLCCEGNRIDKTSPSSQCCGDGDTFEPDQQTCCYGHVRDGVNGSCCMTGKDTYEAYSSLEKKCCVNNSKYGPSYGKVHSKDVRCCGSEQLKESHLCRRYMFRVRQIPKRAPSDNRVCCKLAKPRDCETYNHHTKFCLKGRLISRRTGGSHCGNFPYDRETMQCCNGHIHPKTQNSVPLVCCDTVTYNPELQLCHAGEKTDNIPERFAE